MAEKSMTVEDLENRFTYHSPKDGQPEKYAALRGNALGLACEMNEFCPPSPELYIAITKLEESVFWANAAIARNE